MSPARLYAVRFSDGTVKVGVARSVRSRWMVISTGRRGVEWFCSPPVEHPFAAERILLGAMRRQFLPAEHRERFYVSDFGAVRNSIRHVYRAFGYEHAPGWRHYVGIDPTRRRDTGPRSVRMFA